MKAVSLFILAVMALLVSRCGDINQADISTDAATVLEATRAKMLTTPTHHYRSRVR